MEISQKLKDSALEKSSEGLVQTVKFLLEQTEFKEAFPKFKIEQIKAEKLPCATLAQSSIVIGDFYHKDPKLSVFRENVMNFRDLLTEIFTNYKIQESFWKEVFEEDGSLKKHYKPLDGDMDPHKDYPKYIPAGVSFLFRREIIRKNITLTLPAEEQEILGLENEIEKEIIFFEEIGISFQSYAEIEYELDLSYQPRI